MTTTIDILTRDVATRYAALRAEDDKVVDAAMIKIRDDRGKVRHCPLRPGLRADPYVLDFTG